MSNSLAEFLINLSQIAENARKSRPLPTTAIHPLTASAIPMALACYICFQMALFGFGLGLNWL
jgi:hypothetical protein